MSAAKPVAVRVTTVLMAFARAAVETWAALNTSGLLSLALWAFVALYVVSLLVALIALGGKA